MLRKKNITLNNRKATGREILKENDSIKIFFSDETYEKLSSARDNDFPEVISGIRDYPDVVFEDEDIIIMNKPSGLLSQKAEASDVSLNEMMLAYLAASGGASRETMTDFTPSVMNRLDRQTSGLVIGAKNYQAARMISEDIREHRLKKTYHCIVRGDCRLSGLVGSFWKKNQSENRVEIFDTPYDGSVPIETVYKRLSYENGLTLMEATLVTGRSHQIRAQLSHLGYPILLDPKYGDRELDAGYGRRLRSKGQLLNACRLVLSDGRVFECEDPKEFTEAFRLWLHGRQGAYEAPL